MSRWNRVTGIVLLGLLVAGCAGNPDKNGSAAQETEVTEQSEVSREEDKTAGVSEVSREEDKTAGVSGDILAEADVVTNSEVSEQSEENMDEDGDIEESASADDEKAPAEILSFVDVFGEQYEVEILEDVKKHSYKAEGFVHEGDRLAYSDEDYSYRIGVDVSHHQGAINWDKVKADGFDFAFLRIGYRGYGKEGKLNHDKQFENNIVSAQANGLDVGVYFFAQAVNEEEALEEARFVVDCLKDYELQLPVVYDPESILDAEARTDNVTPEQFTLNTIAFCNAVREAGYEPCVYSNMLWEAYELDLTRLGDVPIWYADYEPLPQTPYNFEYWQYTNEGSVDGISGVCDLDIQIIKK